MGDFRKRAWATGRVFSILAVLSGMLLSVASNASTTDLDPPLAVIAIVKVKPGTEQAFKEAAARIISPSQAESGNLRYEFNQSTDDPTEFATSELWKSRQELDLHMNRPHMQEFFKTVGPYFQEGYPQIRKLRGFAGAAVDGVSGQE